VFLKSLDIHGFKSFADKTHIQFADGITALLGPNGCGKSNVVDAIKWVLAENRSKNLRAEKMEDVIFNGTENRPALNTAEVTLTLCNDKGLLPLDDEEIAITRRLYRSGDQEFFINKRPAGPTEIRRLSKAECAEAERELERTRQNMTQIEISLSEIKKQYDTLKVQSEKTIKYRKFKEEIYNYELDLTLLRLKNFVQDKARHEEELKNIQLKRDKIRKDIEEINNTISENTDKINEMNEELYKKQAEIIGIGKEKNGKLELIKQFNSRSSEIKEKIKNLNVRKDAIEERIESIQEEIDEQNAQLHEKEKQLNDIKKNIVSFNNNIENSSNLITDNERKVDSLRVQIGKEEEERGQLQKQLAEITEDIVAKLDEKLKDAGFSESAMRIAKEELDTNFAKLKIFVSGRKNILEDYSKQNLKGEDCSKIITEAKEAFEESLKSIETVEASLQKYLNASPAFITEFLSPEGIMTKKRAIDSKILENNNKVSKLNEDISKIRTENSNLTVKITEYKETLNKLKINETQMLEQITASKNQTVVLERNLTTEQNTLKNIEDELYSENNRQDEINEQINEVQDELAEIEYRGTKLADELKKLDEEIAKCNKSVSGKSDTLKRKTEEQNRYQEQYERLTLSVNSADNDIKNVKQNFQDQYSRDLMEFEERMYKITTPAAELRDKLSTAKKDFQALGSVNLMAPEEFTEMKKLNQNLLKCSLKHTIRLRKISTICSEDFSTADVQN